MDNTTGWVELVHGDCLDVMKDIPSASIDMILADPPYGTTACKWDSAIPFEPMWRHLNRVIKSNGAIVLFGMQPFTSALIMSNIRMFKYAYVWEKTKPTGFLDAKTRPLNNYEDICVFYNKQPTYNPQMIETGRPFKRKLVHTKRGNSECYNEQRDFETVKTGERYPTRIIKFSSVHGGNSVHPTQKPVTLMEYLINTYTNAGETVLDFTMGSGTTGVACVNIGRNFVGIEKELKYFSIANERIESAKQTVS